MMISGNFRFMAGSWPAMVSVKVIMTQSGLKTFYITISGCLLKKFWKTSENVLIRYYVNNPMKILIIPH